MAAFQTVWSIDVGKSSLKAVKIHRERNSLEILAVDKVDYPVEANGVDSLHGPKEALRTFASRNNIDCPVVVSHPSHSAFFRFIQLPPLDSKKLQEMVGYEAQQQIPFPIDEVIWDYHVCDDEADAQERAIAIFAVRREVIADFMLDYESQGITPDHISVGYIGLLDYVLYDLRPTKPSVIVNIGSDHTDLLIIDGKRFWFRNLTIAGNDVTQALQERFKLPFDEAEKLKRTAAGNKEQMAKVFQLVQPILKELVNEIHRSVGFYKSQAGDVKFEDVYLFGNAAKLIGIQHYLTEHLRFKVHLEKGFRRIRVNRESNIALLQKDFPAFATVVGNGILGLGDGECEVNLLPEDRKEELDFRGKQKTVIAACLSLFIAVVVLWLAYGSAQKSAVRASEQATVVQELKGNQSKIESIDQEVAKLEARAIELGRYGADRKQVPVAIQALSDIFGNFKDPAGLQSTRVFTRDGTEISLIETLGVEVEDARHRNRAFLVVFAAERSKVDATGNLVDAKERARNDKSVTFPAYTFEARVIIYSRTEEEGGSAQAATNFVKERVEVPLEARLTELLGKAIEVNVDPAKDQPEMLFSVHPKFASSRRSGGSDETYEGDTYYEFTLTWTQFASELPKADSGEEEQS